MSRTSQSENASNVRELVRIVDATLQNINHDGLTTGQTAMKFMNFISGLEGFSEFIGSEFDQHFRKYINDGMKKIEEGNSTTNVRSEVKKIFMYPTMEYPPWTHIDVPDSSLQIVNEKCAGVRLRLGMVDGKVYAVPTSAESIIDVVYSELHQCLDSNSLCKNPEKGHITIINSNVVADIGHERVSDFVEAFNSEHVGDEGFSIDTNQVKSTVSNDWSVFRVCYVIDIKCSTIDTFLAQFNEIFETKLKMSKHLTFAIEPRSLW